MSVGHEQAKRRKVGSSLSDKVGPPVLRIEIFHGDQQFDVVTLDANTQPEAWVADYNAMMQPLGLTARLSKP